MNRISLSYLTGPIFFRNILQQFLFAAIIWFGGGVGLLMPFVNSNISPMWPPAGIGLGILLCFGSRFWPSVAIGSFCINHFSFLGHSTLPMVPSLGIMMGSSCSVLFAYAGIQRFRLSRKLETVRDVALFFGICVLLAPVIAAVIGIFTLYLYGLITGPHIGMAILTWWVGDGVGILLFTPFFLTWNQFPQWRLKKWGELVVALALALVFSLWTFQSGDGFFSDRYPVFFVIFPIIFWVAIRFHQQGVSVLSMLICGIGIFATIHSCGIFHLENVHESLLLLQSYIIVICGSGLFLAAIERERSEAARVQQETWGLLDKTSRMVPGVIYQYQFFPDGKHCMPYASEGLRDIYELSPQEVAESAEGIMKILHPDDFERITLSIQESAKKLTPWICEYRVILPKRGLRWLSGQAIPELLADGSIVWHGFISDITDRKRAELELIQAKDSAVSSDRAKSEFLAMMSHEIRTPMNGVIGFTQLLKGTELSELQIDYLNTIEGSGETLMVLLNDLLDLSKIEAGGIELEKYPTDLTALAKEMKRFFQPKADANKITLEFKIDGDLPAVVLVDQIRLRQILNNLMSNAIKFTHQGKVTVSIRTFEVNTESAAKLHLEIRVQDTGIGITRETLSRIFTSFTQADSSITRRYGGTGLGLVIVRRLSELMGGTTEAQSEIGVGSLFVSTIEVEPYAFDLESEETLPELSKKGSTRRLQVLVVEDHPTNQKLTGAILKELGHEATFVEEGEAAIRAWKSFAFDLILMDIQMPVLNGIEATLRIRNLEKSEKRARVKIIAMTANVMQGDQERCLESGMDGYLSKPLMVEELVRFFDCIEFK